MKLSKRLAIITASLFLIIAGIVLVFLKPIANVTGGTAFDKKPGTLCPGTDIYTGKYPTYRASQDFHILKGEKSRYDVAVKEASDGRFGYYYDCWAGEPVRYRLFL